MARSSRPDANATQRSSNSCAIDFPNSRDRRRDLSSIEGRKPMAEQAPQQQFPHFVFGGELTDLDRVEFKDLNKLDIVGIFPNYATAHAAWRAKAQQTVDNAHMRYFIVHMHRLLDPATDRRTGR